MPSSSSTCWLPVRLLSLLPEVSAGKSAGGSHSWGAKKLGETPSDFGVSIGMGYPNRWRMEHFGEKKHGWFGVPLFFGNLLLYVYIHIDVGFFVKWGTPYILILPQNSIHWYNGPGWQCGVIPPHLRNHFFGFCVYLDIWRSLRSESAGHHICFNIHMV